MHIKNIDSNETKQFPINGLRSRPFKMVTMNGHLFVFGRDEFSGHSNFFMMSFAPPVNGDTPVGKMIEIDDRS